MPDHCGQSVQRSHTSQWMPRAVNDNTVIEDYPKREGKRKAIGQIACGVISTILELINLGVCPRPWGLGIWCGAVYAASGSVGLYAAAFRTRRLVTEFRMSSSMSVAAAVVCAITAAIYICFSRFYHTLDDYRSNACYIYTALVCFVGFANIVCALASYKLCTQQLLPVPEDNELDIVSCSATGQLPGRSKNTDGDNISISTQPPTYEEVIANSNIYKLTTAAPDYV